MIGLVDFRPKTKELLLENLTINVPTPFDTDNILGYIYENFDVNSASIIGCEFVFDDVHTWQQLEELILMTGAKRKNESDSFKETAAMRRKEGLCVTCGDKGEFKGLGCFCRNGHGKIFG